LSQNIFLFIHSSSRDTQDRLRAAFENALQKDNVVEACKLASKIRTLDRANMNLTGYKEEDLTNEEGAEIFLQSIAACERVGDMSPTVGLIDRAAYEGDPLELKVKRMVVEALARKGDIKNLIHVIDNVQTWLESVQQRRELDNDDLREIFIVGIRAFCGVGELQHAELLLANMQQIGINIPLESFDLLILHSIKGNNFLKAGYWMTLRENYSSEQYLSKVLINFVRACGNEENMNTPEAVATATHFLKKSSDFGVFVEYCGVLFKFEHKYEKSLEEAYNWFEAIQSRAPEKAYLALLMCMIRYGWKEPVATIIQKYNSSNDALYQGILLALRHSPDSVLVKRVLAMLDDTILHKESSTKTINAFLHVCKHFGLYDRGNGEHLVRRMFRRRSMEMNEETIDLLKSLCSTTKSKINLQRWCLQRGIDTNISIQEVASEEDVKYSRDNAKRKETWTEVTTLFSVLDEGTITSEVRTKLGRASTQETPELKETEAPPWSAKIACDKLDDVQSQPSETKEANSAFGTEESIMVEYVQVGKDRFYIGDIVSESKHGNIASQDTEKAPQECVQVGNDTFYIGRKNSVDGNNISGSHGNIASRDTEKASQEYIQVGNDTFYIGRKNSIDRNNISGKTKESIQQIGHDRGNRKSKIKEYVQVGDDIFYIENTELSRSSVNNKVYSENPEIYESEGRKTEHVKVGNDRFYIGKNANN